MKLTIAIHDNYPIPTRQENIAKPFVECAISGSGDDLDDFAVGAEYVQDGFVQAEQVARLTELSRAIRETIEDYYTKVPLDMPKVVKP